MRVPSFAPVLGDRLVQEYLNLDLDQLVGPDLDFATRHLITLGAAQKRVPA